jgi:hypothetical protein
MANKTLSSLTAGTPSPTDYIYGVVGADSRKILLSTLFASGMADGTAAAPGLAFNSDPDVGLFRPTANTLGIAATSGVQFQNASWLMGRNAADSANLNMFRVNSSNYTEFSNPLYYDETSTFHNDMAALTLVRTISDPSGAPGVTYTGLVNGASFLVNGGKGDNANYRGTTTMFVYAKDRSDVTALNKGVLYGLEVWVAPQVARNNVPNDDAVGIIVVNSGTATATDGVYIGRGGSLGANDDYAGGSFITEAWSDGAFRGTGEYNYGLDLRLATIATAAIGIPNNTWVVARNQANNNDVNIWKLNATNTTEFSQNAQFNSSVQFNDDLLLDSSAIINWNSGDVTLTYSTNALAFAGASSGYSFDSTVAVSNSGSFFTALRLESTSADANNGPYINIYRNSASPAASDGLGVLVFKGKDSGGNDTDYAYISASIIDPTNGSEDGEVIFNAMIGGADTQVWRYGNGVQIGSPTGAYKGAGTLNAASGLYTNGVGVFSGSGAPSLSAPKGSIYTNTTATTTTTRLYVNTDGGTTWTNLTTAA